MHPHGKPQYQGLPYYHIININTAGQPAQNTNIMQYNKSYARELRTARRLAQWADRHQNIINAALAAQVAYMLYYAFMYA